MRRILLAGLAMSLSALAFTPAQAAKTVNATILLPTAVTEAPNGGLGCSDFSNPHCYKKGVLARHVRCLYLVDPTLNQDASTGRFGFVVPLATGDRGRPFTLKDTTGLPATVDFDIQFYSNLGSCEGPPVGAEAQPVEVTPPHYHFGNEAGTTPSNATHAIVTMFGGVNGTFELKIS